jgi:signal transduction histidine kinase
MARLDDDPAQAASLYDRAIAAAGDNGFRQDQALANELAGRFWLAKGNEDFALVHLRTALVGYGAWGAKRKQAALLAAYPQLAERRSGSPPEAGARAADGGAFETGPSARYALFTNRASSTTLDLASVLKACQVISSEIDLDKLLDRLLRVVIESAGAQRAVVMLPRDGHLRIAASITARAGQSTLLTDTPVEASTEIPRLVVQYVARTRAGVVLRDATREGMFTADPYVQAARSRSVLCLPVLHGGKLTGVLYLENDQVAGAFSPGRVELLEILSAQAAIALQNALLLSMERAARTAAEDAEHRAAFFAETSKLLTESLDYEEVLSRLTHLVVTHLAHWCVIDVIEGERVRRLAGEHADPAKLPLLQELQKRYPCRPDSPHPAARVLRTGAPILLSDVSEEVLRAHSEDDEHRRLLRELGLRTLLAVPLVLRGRTLGALTLCSAEVGRRYGPVDVELAQEVANRAAIAIENAQLFQQSQKAVQVRDEFLMVASHELRTPLTPIKMQNQVIRRLVENIAEDALPNREAVLTAIDRSRERIEGLERLFENLLDVSSIGAGKLVVHREELDLSQLVRKTLEGYGAASKLAGCELALRADAPVKGFWDRVRIEQVVVNLLANAMKYGAGKPIEVSVSTEDGRAVLVVRDHGIGIAREDQSKLGIRFERAASVRHYGGLGLGLYIAREIVLAHAGTMRVESELGRGAAFIVELPASSTATAAYPRAG